MFNFKFDVLSARLNVTNDKLFNLKAFRLVIGYNDKVFVKADFQRLGICDLRGVLTS